MWAVILKGGVLDCHLGECSINVHHIKMIDELVQVACMLLISWQLLIKSCWHFLALFVCGFHYLVLQFLHFWATFFADLSCKCVFGVTSEWTETPLHAVTFKRSFSRFLGNLTHAKPEFSYLTQPKQGKCVPRHHPSLMKTLVTDRCQRRESNFWGCSR